MNMFITGIVAGMACAVSVPLGLMIALAGVLLNPTNGNIQPANNDE